MKAKWTKKQILESIKHWKSVLESMSDVNVTVGDFKNSLARNLAKDSDKIMFRDMDKKAYEVFDMHGKGGTFVIDLVKSTMNESDNEDKDADHEDDDKKDKKKTDPAVMFLKGAASKFNDQKVDPNDWKKLDDMLWDEMQSFVKEYKDTYNLKLKDFAVDVDRAWMKLYDKFQHDKMFMALGDSTRQMIVKASK